MLNYSCWWYKTKILLWKVDAKKYQIFLSKDNSIVSTRFHKVFLYVIFLSLNINPCHINYIFSSIFWKFYHFCVSSFRDLFLFIIYITLFVSHKSIIWHRFFMHTSVLHHEYLCVYITAKNGSVFKMIPEIVRKKSIRMELLNLIFSLKYKSNSKRNFFWDTLYYYNKAISR